MGRTARGCRYLLGAALLPALLVFARLAEPDTDGCGGRGLGLLRGVQEDASSDAIPAHAPAGFERLQNIVRIAAERLGDVADQHVVAARRNREEHLAPLGDVVRCHQPEPTSPT